VQSLWLLLLGLGVGVFGTLIGAGGGFILMPILLLCYPKTSPDLLTAISLAVVCSNATAGSISYSRMKRIDYKSGLLFLTTGVPGAVLGAIAVEHIPRAAFDLVFGVLLLGASLFILMHPAEEHGPISILRARFHRTIIEADGTHHEYAFSLPLGMTVSFGVGFISSLLGLGGGIIHVPAMVHLLSFPVHLATATSHFLLAVMAFVGTGIHVVDGSFDDGLRMAAPLALGAVFGAPLGARLSQHIRGRWIMRVLGGALGLVAARILLLALWR
jgi:uncharacterized membrane protein YfcA